MIQTVWARVLCASLRDAGVREVVVSPGSRSTPLVAAALHAGLHCRPIIDERAAGFFALGLARVSGVPPLLICSSGTAAAHYFPAIIEAAHTFTPLIVLTADRPPELHRCAAPQTIDQTRIYGQHVRDSFDLGIAEATEASLLALRRKATQAVLTALAGPPGPVHLNAPARKPLEPAGAVVGEPARIAAAVLARPITRVAPPRRVAANDTIAQVAEACRTARRGLIVAGPAPLARHRSRAAVAALARATGFPILAEAASQLRLTGARRDPLTRCDGFDLVLAATARDLRFAPDLILQLDAPPTSAGFAVALAAHPDCPRIVLCEHGWPDPHSTAAAIVLGQVDDTVGRLAAALAEAPTRPEPDWADRWRAADAEVWSQVEIALADRQPGMSQGQAIRAIAAHLPEGSLLMLANSTPIRDLDAFCPSSTVAVDVISQRGVNGIDGLIAGAAGAACAGDRPVTLIIGDVAFAHDLGGLATATELGAPLCVCVLDNGGGRIFERLPVAADPTLADQFARYWLTPPRCDFAAAAATYGHHFATADGPDQLGRAVAQSLAPVESSVMPSCTVLRAAIDAERGAADRQRLTAAVTQRLTTGAEASAGPGSERDHLGTKREAPSRSATSTTTARADRSIAGRREKPR